MKYFILEVDQAYIPPRPTNWYGRLDVKALAGKRHYELPKHMVFQVEQHMQMVWTDIIMEPCFMLGSRAKEVLELYEPSLRFVRVIFSDKEKFYSQPYYIPSLAGAPALTENSKFNLNRSVIHHAEVNGSVLRDRAIVRVTNVNQSNCVLIRSDIAESLLTNNTIGIGLRETDIIMPCASGRSRF